MNRKFYYLKPLLVTVILLCSLYAQGFASQDGGYDATPELWLKAELQVPGSPVMLIWKMVGQDISPSGDQIISGYFYADPKDFAYGSIYNPEVFVKIYIATNGWCNIAFNHVTVDDVTVFSSHHYAGSADQTGISTLASRLVEHQYNGVTIQSTPSPDGGLAPISIDSGYTLTSGLWAKAILQPSIGPVTLIWKEVGSDTTPSGDKVVSGYFYADSGDFAYGSEFNPEVFVKIYIAANGWANIAFNHVTVDTVSVYSAHNYNLTPQKTGAVKISTDPKDRLAEHQYDGVSIDTGFSVQTVSVLPVTPHINSGPERITDPVSGYTFEVPGGQSGELRVAVLNTAPAAPFPGAGLMIEAVGLDQVELILPGGLSKATDFPIVYAYGAMQGAFDDDIGYADRWVALAYVEKEAGQMGFVLPSSEPISEMKVSVSPDLAPLASSPSGPAYYFVSKIDANTPESDQRNYVGLQVAAYAIKFKDALNSTAITAVQSREIERAVSITYGGSYYTGFNKMRAFSWGRNFSPVIAIPSPTKTGDLAHETSHYLTHLLVGHSVFDQLASSGGSIFSSHSLSGWIGRYNLLEDYAFYIENFLLDHMQPHNSASTFSRFQGLCQFFSISPRNIDYPALEGFAASMLLILQSPDFTMLDHIGISQPKPSIYLLTSQVLDIIAQGATSVDALRENLFSSMDTRNRQAFQVILQRMGWNYSIRGCLVDDNGDPIKNARVKNYAIVEFPIADSNEVAKDRFYGGEFAGQTDTDGYFSIIGGIFGGSSMLTVTLENGLAVDIPINMDWTASTTSTIDLGDVRVVDHAVHKEKFSFDYVYESWPQGFSVKMEGALDIEVDSRYEARMRVVRSELLEDHEPMISIYVYVPPEAVVTLKGTIILAPSSFSGVYNDESNETISWRLEEYSTYATPDNAFKVIDESTRTVEYVIDRQEEGLKGAVLFMGSGYFTKNGTQSRSLDTRIRVVVYGE